MKGKPQRQRDQHARRRAELILKVRSGQLSASEAARRLGVSRKTYYKWEKRGLQGMLEALGERPAGRPEHPVDPEKERLLQEAQSLRRELLLARQRMAVRELTHGMIPGKREGPPEGRAKKKERGKEGDG
jgi:transposase